MRPRHPDARAEVWRYDDPGHPEQGTWSFQVIDRPWTQPMPDPAVSHILDVPGDQVAYPTWQAAFEAARGAVLAARHSAREDA